MVIILVVMIPIMYGFCKLMGHDTGRDLTKHFASMRGIIRIFLKYIQTMSVIASFSVDFPVDLRWFFDIFKLIRIDVNPWAIVVSCLGIDQGPGLIIGNKLVLPLIGLALAAIAWLLSKPAAVIVKKISPKWGEVTAITKDEYAKFALSFWGILFATLTLDSSIIFQCVGSPNGKNTVKDYPDLECFESSGWWNLFPMAMAGVVFYVVAHLAMMITVAVTVHKQLGKSREARGNAKDAKDAASWEIKEGSDLKTRKELNRGRLGFVVEDYRDLYVHWHVYVLLKDLSLVLIGVGASGAPTTQLLLAMGVILIYGTATYVEAPFLDPSNNIMESGVNFVVLVPVLALSAGLGFGMDDPASLFEGGIDNPAYKERAYWLLALNLIGVLVPISILFWQLLVGRPMCEKRFPKCCRRPTYKKQLDRIEYVGHRMYTDEKLEFGTMADIMQAMDDVEFKRFDDALASAGANVGVVAKSRTMYTPGDLLRLRMNQSHQEAAKNWNTQSFKAEAVKRAGSRQISPGTETGKSDESARLAAEEAQAAKEQELQASQAELANLREAHKLQLLEKDKEIEAKTRNILDLQEKVGSSNGNGHANALSMDEGKWDVPPNNPAVKETKAKTQELDGQEAANTGTFCCASPP
jgi:hypothetical protein